MFLCLDMIRTVLERLIERLIKKVAKRSHKMNTQQKIIKAVLNEYLCGGVINQKGCNFHGGDNVKKVGNLEALKPLQNLLKINDEQYDEIIYHATDLMMDIIDAIVMSDLIALK